MRVLRIAPACQLALFGSLAVPGSGWDGLPEGSRAEALALLARMISRGLLAGDADAAAGNGEGR